MLFDNAKSTHIASELSKLEGSRKGSNSTMIKCPWHDDSTPSCRVWHRSGYAQCYGCGTKGTFDDVAAAKGLEPFVKDPMRPASSASIMKPPRASREEDFEYDKSDLANYTSQPLPKDKKWRSISTNLLIDLGCRLITHKEYGAKFVYMPCIVKGEVRGYTRARLTKEEGRPSYIHAKGSWSKRDGLFPFDYSISLMRSIGSQTAVLVEGQRDALRLVSAGIPTMCILGTKSWSDNKILLLESSGVERVILLMDGDTAGKDASSFLKQSLTGKLTIKELKLWNAPGSKYKLYLQETDPERKKALKDQLYDPGNMPESFIKQIRNSYFK